MVIGVVWLHQYTHCIDEKKPVVQKGADGNVKIGETLFKPAYFVLESSHHFDEFYRIKKFSIILMRFKMLQGFRSKPFHCIASLSCLRFLPLQ